MKVTKIKAGHYSVGDGRRIIKSGAQWYIYKGNGEIDFGPVPTLASAKEYVSTGSISLTSMRWLPNMEESKVRRSLMPIWQLKRKMEISLL